MIGSDAVIPLLRLYHSIVCLYLQLLISFSTSRFKVLCRFLFNYKLHRQARSNLVKSFVQQTEINVVNLFGKEHSMEQQGLTPRDLEPFIGPSGRVSEVLNRKRRLSLCMVKSLHDGLNFPYESLLAQAP